MSQIDHDAVLRELVEESGWSARYAFLIVIAAGIALLGLLMSSVAVLIGAMLLSPLMMPIMGLGFGIATLDFREIRRSATALLMGCAIAIALTTILSTMSPIQTITPEIAARTQPTLFDLLVALLSAMAGSYALIRGRGGAAVGVAIATALMPPLTVVGFGLAIGNWTVFSGALLLFLTNAVTIALTAALIARLYGFGSHLSPHHTGWQLILFFAALGILAIPLGAALKRIAYEAVVQRQTRDVLQARFPAGARLSQVEIDPGADPVRVRAVMLTPKIAPNADGAIFGDLTARLHRPVDVHVDQLLITPETSGAEALQIAKSSETSASNAGNRERAAAALALVAGVEPAAIRIDEKAKRLSATAAALPGLGLAGYRALEGRANGALQGWTAMLAPPADVTPPDIAIRDGVIDDAALGLAGWGSQRLNRTIEVLGGTAGQREAVAEGIVARGGRAEPGDARGSLRLEWQAVNAAPEGTSAG
ncbi:DUF389 domain-containing protein [Sphingomonas crocodyli]|uniref:DUF389 domain-containing protein n=1 Tax=Sphingomonas crocodyli TaxID=1979270 RepID=A0A437MBU9_9SPHN|nr:DUF389 domain-containing protein [Sphingomonas crocodyli]